MVRRESVDLRLKELDGIIYELSKYRDASPEMLKKDLSLRWIIERGMIAGASIIFDVADHILSDEFGFYSGSYEDSLRRKSRPHPCLFKGRLDRAYRPQTI